MQASLAGVVVSPAPPEDALVSEREDAPPRFIASRTTGFPVPHQPAKGPEAYPREVKDKRRV